MAIACLPSAAGAQDRSERLFRSNMLSVSVFGGGIAFSDFRRESAPIAGDEPLERRLSASTSFSAAGALTYWLNGRWGVRLHASYAPSRLELRRYAMPDDELRTRAADDLPLSGLDVWMYDADVLFRLPLPLGRVQPYGIAGLGVVDYRLRTKDNEVVPESVTLAFHDRTQQQFAGVLGLGAIVALERHRLHLNFELTNHIARTPLSESPLSAERRDPESGDRVDEVGYTSNLRLMLGLAIPLF
jgi:hypothetical protein